ncbi:hypothetical protein DFQ01_14430 [Paenibacillus cellulosilyticus]|uniref:Uncharacterized protein n=1 Tax=Paenibacillus cellulosilyticus TaxID=375489 RepID=A0A2V2YEV9_9BACL|nr:hypothetical protein [Paenibacillus cellulosilyticus]PWV90254.1 hypothetical protein DFQ01_14430 [Paenibacillus cellulosilyticus]QKS43412.1 hypothetical protein HUB94_02505 [Paenibacillus cellulosilyticus]
MTNIVRLNTPQNNMIEALEFLLEKAKAGDIQSFVFAAKDKTDGNIATSWGNCDVGEQQELCSHLQVDIMYRVVEANMDRLIERL